MEKKGQKLGLLTPVLILSFISWEFLGKSFLFSRCWFPYFLKKWSNQPALVCCQDQWDDIHKKWSCSVMSYSLKPHGHEPTRLLSPGNFPGKSTGVGCHFLLQGIFPTQGSNPGLPHCRQTLHHLSYQGSQNHHGLVENTLQRHTFWPSIGTCIDPLLPFMEGT